MREDFAKKFVELGKRGGEKQDIPYDISDEAAQRESMRIHRIKKWGGKDTYFNYNLFYRWLSSKVGQKWDDVYSEICKAFKGKYTNLVPNVKYSGFYIEDGILLKEKRKRWRREKPVQKIFELDNKYFFKHDDIWWRCEFQLAPKYTYTYRRVECSDVFGKYYTNSEYFYGCACFCTKKEQANSREIKKLKKEYDV